MSNNLECSFKDFAGISIVYAQPVGSPPDIDAGLHKIVLLGEDFLNGVPSQVQAVLRRARNLRNNGEFNSGAVLNFIYQNTTPA